MLQKLKNLSRRFLVFVNIAAALSFLIGCYAYLFSPEKYWIIGAFALTSFYFLILLLLFLLFWIFVRSKFFLISLISIIAAWNPIQHLIQLNFSSNFKPFKEPSSIRIMSWNIEHFEITKQTKQPERRKNMFEVINTFSPDVACFQEVVATSENPDATNYIPDIMKKLGFSSFHYTYNPRLDFDHTHHFGIAIFSRYPIINKKSISYPPHTYNSIFQYVDIVKNEDTFRVFNFHLQSLKFNRKNLALLNNPEANNVVLKESKSIIGKFRRGLLFRAQQSERIASVIAQSPHPVIVCGDFNDVPNSYAYHTIGNGLQNAFVKKGSGLGRTFYKIAPTLRIDNIFVDKRFKVQQFERVKKYISDHYPVIADVIKE